MLMTMMADNGEATMKTILNFLHYLFLPLLTSVQSIVIVITDVDDHDDHWWLLTIIRPREKSEGNDLGRRGYVHITYLNGRQRNTAITPLRHHVTRLHVVLQFWCSLANLSQIPKRIIIISGSSCRRKVHVFVKEVVNSNIKRCKRFSVVSIDVSSLVAIMVFNISDSHQ